MADGFNVAQIMEWTSGRLANAEALGDSISGLKALRIAELAGSGPEDACFFFAKKYQAELLKAAPAVLITGDPFVAPLEASGLPLWRHSAVIACSDPYLAMAVLSEKFAPLQDPTAYLPDERMARTGPAEIHPTAIVDPSARLGAGVVVGPWCYVEADVRVGRGSVLIARVHLGRGVVLGEGCTLFTNTTLYPKVQLGNRVRLHSGVVLGSDGFGYAPVLQNGKPVDHRKIYHFGGVEVGDDVEIGANSMVDRATLGNTVIGAKVKIDNDVHIAHNVRIGEGTIFCGQSGAAGGAEVGRFVYVGGLSGIGKVVVGDYARIGGCSKIENPVEAGAVVVGNPQRSYRDHFKANVILNRLIDERGARKKRDPS